MEFEKIKAIITAEYCLDDIEITEDTTFSELGFDSLDMIDLVMDIEDEFEVEVDDETIEGFVTVGDVVNFLKHF